MSRSSNHTDSPHLYSRSAEQALLGCLLLQPEVYPDVRDQLEPDDFRVPEHRRIYEEMREAIAQTSTVDSVILIDELSRQGVLQGVSGTAYIDRLKGKACPSRSLDTYARKIRDYAVRRQLLNIGSEIIRSAKDTGLQADEATVVAEQLIAAVHRPDPQVITANSVATRVQRQITEWMNNPLGPGETRGLATGIGPLDRAMGGLEVGLYLLAARPSMGKTSLVLQLVGNIARRKQRVLLFSVEMSAHQIMLQMACSQARVSQDLLKRGQVLAEDHERVLRHLDEIKTWPLFIRDGGPLRPTDVQAAVRRQQAEGEVSAVFVDGLWLMASNEETRTRNLELGSISRGLKLASQNLQVPLVAVHQLSRAVEQRNDKRPLLSDLRESGRLEEDADLVLMLYREGYYDQQAPNANVAEIWIRKNRLGGPAGRRVRLYWQGDYTWFAELANSKQPN